MKVSYDQNLGRRDFEKSRRKTVNDRKMERDRRGGGRFRAWKKMKGKR